MFLFVLLQAAFLPVVQLFEGTGIMLQARQQAGWCATAQRAQESLCMLGLL